MGAIIEAVATPISRALDALVVLKISWVPVGMLAFLAIAIFAVCGFSAILERASITNKAFSDPDTVIFRMICLFLNCALAALFCTEYCPPNNDFAPILSGVSGGMSAANFSQWGVMYKLFFWCAIINAGTTLIGQIILGKHTYLFLPFLLSCIGGTALGYSLMPLSVSLCEFTVLFLIVLPIIEALIIGILYLASVVGLIFCFISLGSANTIARNAANNLPKYTYSDPASDKLWNNAVDEIRRAQEHHFPQRLTAPDGQTFQREWVAGDRAGYWCARNGMRAEFHADDFKDGRYPYGWR